ncbi:sensor histidine kinase [Ekhidna sp.]
MISFIRRVISKTWIQHLVFWMLSLYGIGSYFSISNEVKVIDFIYSLFFHIPLLTLVYFNIRYHLPKFLQKERYLIYGLLSFLNIALAYFLHEIIFEVLIPVLPTDFYMVSFTDFSVLITIFIIYLALTTLLKLSKSWYQLQQLEKEKLSLELNSLKMQINPHFLFNSLNSVYSLSLKKSDQTPQVILGLSNLLRYMIYEVSEERVPLLKEVESLRNYLNLQKLRVDETADIQLDISGEINNQKLAPLLFFPLIENSFKHGLKSNNNFVHVKLEVTEKALVFMIKNNKGKVDEPEDGRYGGIGLENVRKRLDIIYNKKASMEVKNKDESFEVTLTIDLDD